MASHVPKKQGTFLDADAKCCDWCIPNATAQPPFVRHIVRRAAPLPTFSPDHVATQGVWWMKWMDAMVVPAGDGVENSGVHTYSPRAACMVSDAMFSLLTLFAGQRVWPQRAWIVIEKPLSLSFVGRLVRVIGSLPVCSACLVLLSYMAMRVATYATTTCQAVHVPSVGLAPGRRVDRCLGEGDQRGRCKVDGCFLTFNSNGQAAVVMDACTSPLLPLCYQALVSSRRLFCDRENGDYTLPPRAPSNGVTSPLSRARSRFTSRKRS
ncbi:uncharacterized protein J3D65DRAFT_299032 [Phyllosticta citribraziliensis]|uniref:Uncharacterized protein n=1 Tax=Phyllosticta citribraziliensis TaxID=989973 RepID=A0ABR1LZ07_9PEZI